MTSEIHLLWMNSVWLLVTVVLIQLGDLGVEANKQLSTSSGWMSRAGGGLLFVVQDGTTATQQALRGTRQGPVYIHWTFKIKARTLSTSKRIATFTQKGEKQTPKSMMAAINMQGRATQVSFACAIKAQRCSAVLQLDVAQLESERHFSSDTLSSH